ncbi:MAG TPA: cupin domain-containing protein [Protaetiibacter sp.]|nr:cupin domain-containing protein [Protaetiibacter sp.]
MKHSSISRAEWRHGDWGPAYLVQGPTSDIGALLLRPGDEMANHLHDHCDESFVVIEGECTLWIDCKEKHTMRVGDVFRCEPGEMHYLINESDADFRLVFIKSPASPGDTVLLPWQPGDPAPMRAA